MLRIDHIQYHEDLIKLKDLIGNNKAMINQNRFDCIVALKRSGWIVGCYLSNVFDIPVFTESEIKSIPTNKFKSILLVDDKIYSGKSINKAKLKIYKHFGFRNINIKIGALYLEGNKSNNKITIDYQVLKLDKSHKMWYE